MRHAIIFKISLFVLIFVSSPTQTITSGEKVLLGKLSASEEKKIIALSIPKSGTTLLRKTIKLITSKPVISLGLRVRFFDPKKHLKNKSIAESHHTTDVFNQILQNYNDQYIKIILIRDLRDVIISWRNWIVKGKDPHPSHIYQNISVKEGLKKLINQKVHMNYIKNAILWSKDPTVLIVRFEDLVGPLGGGNKNTQINTVIKIANHLGYAISYQEAVNISNSLFGGTTTFFEGKIYKWKNVFDEELLKLFEKVYGKSFIELGYKFNPCTEDVIK